jgi:hypothetical protein
MPRLLRRFFVSQTKKLRKKHAYLKDIRDSEGKRPTIVVRQVKAGQMSLECVIEYPEGTAEEIKNSEKGVRVA